jgi:hypothetical protein
MNWVGLETLFRADVKQTQQAAASTAITVQNRKKNVREILYL